MGSSKWYAKAVAWASTNGIVNGVGNNKFNPNGPVTREQLALILFGYSKMQGCDVSGGVTLAGFADQSKVSAWAFDAMSWAVGEGLLSGTIKNGQPYLQPKASATRAQVATILMAYIEQYLAKQS